ncbi:MAG: patatin-like phospholipase family protein [Pseudomonadota bacterium]
MRINVVLIILISLQLGCATSVIHTPVPENQISNAVVMQAPSIRFWGDDARNEEQTQKKLEAWLALRKQHKFEQTNQSINFLALSGGGEDGSFAAGIITGWTRHGTRPEFDVITGVSAGALASPFVFLGPEYDEILFEVYSNLGNDDIYNTQIFSGLFGGTAILDTRPLKELISHYVTSEVLQKIAFEHAKGRRLWIGTTNLDAGRPVIWDIGEIAASGRTQALELVHDILLASSAVPGIFPPVIINVMVGDQQYTELHVDGGVTRQVFLYPPQYIQTDMIDTVDENVERNLYIIRNGRSQAIYDPVKTSLYSISLKALSMTIENKAVGDLYRIYELTMRDGIDYNLAIIPKSFSLKPNESFDPEYTKALFNLGYKLAKSGYIWKKAPPEIDH